MRLYLQDIGRVDLLSHEEELTLARLVQRREDLLNQRHDLATSNTELAKLEQLEELRQREASRLGHQPSQAQWAHCSSLSIPELRQHVQQARYSTVRGVPAFILSRVQYSANRAPFLCPQSDVCAAIFM